MKYPEPKERSEEYLRSALGLMSKHQAAFNPITYAVWYEYASGANAALNREIDSITGAGNKLDEAATRRLHQAYIAELDEQTAVRLNTQFQHLLSEISESAARTGVDADQFGARLEQWGRVLGDDLSAPALRERVTGVLRDTRGMHSSITTLTQRLEASQSEIARLKQEVTRAREEAMIDGLTGLLNRKAFDEKIHALLSAEQKRSTPLCLIMVDIDHFKGVNDTFGHVFGDRVIRTVSEAMKATVKGQDIVARYGGEEFALLLPETPLSGAQIVAERLRDNVANSRTRRFNSEELVSGITISSGIAAHRAGESVTTFVERADVALYASKSQGRNCVTVASDPASVRPPQGNVQPAAPEVGEQPHKGRKKT